MTNKTTMRMTYVSSRIFHVFRSRAFRVAIGILFVLLGLDVAFPFRPAVQSGTLITDNDGKTLTAFLSPDEKWRFPMRIADVSPVLIKAVILKEDSRFRWHPGVDPLAILRAAIANVTQGRRASGASTITMQVARLLETRPRTLWSKLVEAVHAMQLELHYSKDEILEMYLWLVPYGGNVEGIRAASMLYLGTTPDKLSVAEATTLLIVPNRPTSLRLGGNATHLRRARNAWIDRLLEHDVIDRAAAAAARSEPVVLARTPTPRQAWHLSVRLAHRLTQRSEIRTTINGLQQQAIEALTKQHVNRLRMLGITNASVIVVENATRSVVAYVGSANPADVVSSGQVDGVQAVRSPGSTLKPFIYAAAVDRGLMTPRTMVEDVPINLDGYAPENFDRRFLGAMSMQQALATSRNVPAVTTLQRLGIDAFTDILGKARVSTITGRRLGLSLALGGCGMRLDELTGLYAAFACGGTWKPLRWTVDGTVHDSAQLMSAAAAYMISEVLTTPSRPDLPNGFDASANLPRIAWKTGTSYGRRDAWSIGYNRRYTVGVWVGNFDGSGNEHLTGSQSATPLLFDVFNTIDRSQDARWLKRPSSLDTRFVCAMSGLPPADSCTDQVVDAFIPRVSPATRCDHQREMYVNPDRSVSYCTMCLPATGWKRSMELNMPPPVLSYMRAQGLTLRTPPPHEPSCTRVFEGDMHITAPVDGKTYVLEKATETQLRCDVVAPTDATMLYWFIDDVFVTATPSGGSIFITPEAGRRTVECVDDRGRRARTTFTVKFW
ncbi:MAG: penicillin-binding protein 1C [Candidatus Kapabacteria bacterium]|nr:penicillin-binding protein 1C [Candidatus Kapabacteria bacterium]